MIKKNQGIIVFLKKIKDNDIYIRVLTKDDELVSGMVYGGNSSKKKSFYQLGYFIEYSISQKNINIIPTFNGNIIEPLIGNIINDKFKSYSLLTIISLINLSIVEGQKINGFYKSVKDIVVIISLKRHWISYFCEWLFTLLKLIGYQIDYKNNQNYKYFNLITQDFENSNIKNSINFPHKILEHNSVVDFNDVNAIFKIFESIYSKNHLNNMNYNMPTNFIIFKNSILKYLNNLNV